MLIEEISESNLRELTQLMLELWPECVYDEEYQNCRRIMTKSDETCYLIKSDKQYAAFIQLSLRHDYVEGTETSPVGYIEGIYVKPEFRKSGLAGQLVQQGEKWVREKGCRQYASDTEIDNQVSISFHKKQGFTEISRLVCFVKDL